MRELVFKNLMSKDKTRSEVSMTESYEAGDVFQLFFKENKFKIIAVYAFCDRKDIDGFLEQELKKNYFPDTYFIHILDTQRGLEEYVYKISGSQYVIINAKVFVLKSSYCYKRIVKKIPTTA